MLGAIIGDIVGSRFEYESIKTKSFEFITDDCFFTDDTVMTIAVGKALIDCKVDYTLLTDKVIETLRYFGSKYPDAGYGGMFTHWLESDHPNPYHSYGNGSAMRVSACGIVGKSIEEVKMLSKKVTEVTHNHPESITAAEATAMMVYMARNNHTKEEMKAYCEKHYYPLDFSIDEVREYYFFSEKAKETVPYAIQSFMESDSFEDAIRNAISLGGDADTLGAITGSIAGEYYGIPKMINEKALNILDKELRKQLNDFEDLYASKVI